MLGGHLDVMQFRDSRISRHDQFRPHLGELSLCSVALQARRTRRQALDHVSRDAAAPVLPDLCRGRISEVISDGDHDAGLAARPLGALVLPDLGGLLGNLLIDDQVSCIAGVSLTVIFASQARQSAAKSHGVHEKFSGSGLFWEGVRW
jgi:hypothetical protein